MFKLHLKFNNRLNKKILSIQENILSIIEEILKVGLRRKISIQKLIELKNMLFDFKQYASTKNTYQDLLLIEKLLGELHLKLEKEELNSTQPYVDKCIILLDDLKAKKSRISKFDYSSSLDESFIVERNIAEASARIEKISRLMRERLSEAKGLQKNDSKYIILSHEYGGQKDRLKLELDQLTRLLSTKKRRDSFNMLKLREQNIQIANTLAGVSFEEAQEILIQVQSIENEFDEVEESWKSIYQAYHLDEDNLYDDTLSKDIERSYLDEIDSETQLPVQSKEEIEDK